MLDMFEGSVNVKKKCVFKASWKQQTIFNPEPHAILRNAIWTEALITAQSEPSSIWSQQFSHRGPFTNRGKWVLIHIDGYWILVLSKRVVEKAMQWWTEVGAGEDRGAEYFWTNFLRMPHSTGRPVKGERDGVALRGADGTRLQVWSNHSARLGALHVCMSTASSQSLHSTAQHHLNLHSHLVICLTLVVS